MRHFDDRYVEKIDHSGGPDACWPWTAGTNNYGYGLISRGRRGEGLVLAHRVALERRLGRPLKPGHCACHHCDNPPCCNPEHLFEGTLADNNRDMSRKGRAARGESAGNTKLTEAMVLEIRSRAQAGEYQRTLAAEFGVSRENVSLIVNRVNWRHVA